MFLQFPTTRNNLAPKSEVHREGAERISDKQWKSPHQNNNNHTRFSLCTIDPPNHLTLAFCPQSPPYRLSCPHFNSSVKLDPAISVSRNRRTCSTQRASRFRFLNRTVKTVVRCNVRTIRAIYQVPLTMYKLVWQQGALWYYLKVIPLNCIAHPFCARFFAWLAGACSELGSFLWKPLFREINGRFLLIEHGDPHFWLYKLNRDSVPKAK